MDQRIFQIFMENFFEVGDKVEVTVSGDGEEESKVISGEIECITCCIVKVRDEKAVHHEKILKMNRKIPQWEVRERLQDFATRLVFVEDLPHEERQRLFRDIAVFLKVHDDELILGWNRVFDKEIFNLTLREVVENFFEDEKSRGNHHFYEIAIQCMRAATDIATEQWSQGVVGYSIGDLRKMYPDGIPPWVQKAIGLQGDEEDHERLIL